MSPFRTTVDLDRIMIDTKMVGTRRVPCISHMCYEHVGRSAFPALSVGRGSYMQVHFDGTLVSTVTVELVRASAA